MRGLGLSCSLINGRPSVVGVLAEHAGSGISGHEIFRHLADPQEGFPLQLVALANALESALPDIRADAVIVRSMDWSRFGRGQEVMQKRYSVEGVLLATARARVERTTSLSGREIGQRLASSKEEADG